MADERKPVFRAFYTTLLRLYPRQFRERFSESMQQTFDDICNEREERLLSLTIKISVDTGVGIVKEHILQISKRGVMSEILKNPKMAAIIGTLLFVPGAIIFSLLLLGVEPQLGFLEPYMQPSNPDAPHLAGSLFFLTLIIIFPAAAVLINVAATETNFLKNTFANFGVGAVVALLIILPFMILEVVHGQSSYSDFPIGLFVVLWFLPTIFITILMPVIRTQLSTETITQNPIKLVLQVGFLVLIAVFWIGLVNDQMPCFLGVPNCD